MDHHELLAKRLWQLILRKILVYTKIRKKRDHEVVMVFTQESRKTMDHLNNILADYEKILEYFLGYDIRYMDLHDQSEFSYSYMVVLHIRSRRKRNFVLR